MHKRKVLYNFPARGCNTEQKIRALYYLPTQEETFTRELEKYQLGTEVVLKSSYPFKIFVAEDCDLCM